jgi:cephalosporin-C deacetylase-like acetyl esterase
VFGQLPRPKDRVPLDVQILQQRQIDDGTLQTVSYAPAAGVRVKADVWLPETSESTAPGLVLVNQFVASKSSAASSDILPTQNIAKELAHRGYACIVPEFPNLDERIHGPQSFARHKDARVMEDIWTCMRAADLLESLPQVNGDRIGCVGCGFGAQLSLLTAVLDQRIAATMCSGEFAMVDVQPQASPSFAFPELIAAISPRALSLRVTSATPAQEKEA